MNAGDVLGAEQEALTLGTAADEGDLQHLIGGDGLGRRGLAGGEIHTRAGQDTGADEVAAVHEVTQAGRRGLGWGN